MEPLRGEVGIDAYPRADWPRAIERERAGAARGSLAISRSRYAGGRRGAGPKWGPAAGSGSWRRKRRRRASRGEAQPLVSKRVQSTPRPLPPAGGTWNLSMCRVRFPRTLLESSTAFPRTCSSALFSARGEDSIVQGKPDSSEGVRNPLSGLPLASKPGLQPWDGRSALHYLGDVCYRAWNWHFPRKCILHILREALWWRCACVEVQRSCCCAGANCFLLGWIGFKDWIGLDLVFLKKLITLLKK